MAQAAIITADEVKHRLGPDRVRRLYDDNNDGATDRDPLQQLAEDASSKIRAAVPSYNPDDITLANAALTTELRRLALDMVEIMAARRPGSGVDWVPMQQQLNIDLDLVRKGQASLGSKANPAPADHSVSVVSGSPSSGDYWP